MGMSTSEDPTAFDISFDPTESIMSGRIIHDNLDFSAPSIFGTHVERYINE